MWSKLGVSKSIPHDFKITSIDSKMTTVHFKLTCLALLMLWHTKSTKSLAYYDIYRPGLFYLLSARTIYESQLTFEFPSITRIWWIYPTVIFLPSPDLTHSQTKWKKKKCWREKCCCTSFLKTYGKYSMNLASRTIWNQSRFCISWINKAC